MRLLVATRNPHKVVEMQEILGDDVTLVSLLEYPDAPEVEEDGATFEENAIKKATSISQHFLLPVLADDSGLEIDALHGDPGVRSARFAGSGASSEDLCRKVLFLMKDVPWEKRTARFRCVIALADGREVSIAQGTVEGYITTVMEGEKGFGYDPIFYYPPAHKTFAQMDMSAKNSVSHRGKALAAVKKLLANSVGLR